jgi:hypothetical protein
MHAHRDAREQLAKARAERSDPYLAVGRTLVQYIVDRISQPVSGLTRSAIAGLLASRDIPPSVIERVETCLVASEGGRFAPRGDLESSREALLDETEAVIGDLEREFSR